MTEISPEDYAKWSDHHSSLMGFKEEHHKRMMTAWYELLRGFSLTELVRATNAMATFGNIPYPAEQLSHLRRIIFANRKRLEDRKEFEKKRQMYLEGKGQPKKELTDQRPLLRGIGVMPSDIKQKP